MATMTTNHTEALEEERRKFQLETLRTSELSQLISRWLDIYESGHDYGHDFKNCIRCKLVAESKELLVKPVNAQQLPNGGSNGSDSAAGWVLVPRQPTTAQIVAAFPYFHPSMTGDYLEQVYKAMLAAAPRASLAPSGSKPEKDE